MQVNLYRQEVMMMTGYEEAGRGEWMVVGSRGRDADVISKECERDEVEAKYTKG